VAECVLPDRIKAVFQKCVDNKSVDQSMLLTGTPGTGKTTVAMAMCDEIGLNYMLVNSSDERGINTIRTKIAKYATTVSMVGGKKVIIMDEADYITPEAQANLRGVIEEFSSNCSFIFTCNYKSRIIEAIHSRCSVIDFTLTREEKPLMALEFFKRVKDVLAKEGVEYDQPSLVKIVEKFFPDYRRTLNELQRYGSVGPIDAGVVAQIDRIRGLSELIKHLKEKNFDGIRKWAALNSDIDSSVMYRGIYDGVVPYMASKDLPEAVVVIAKYMYRSSFVADQEINMAACLTELMAKCEVK
jgi:DNA polymerase III delta prime subunit